MDLALAESYFVEAIKHFSWLAPAAAFGGGVLTALNPCVLAMVPLIIGLVGGYSQGPGVMKRSVAFSVLFVTGFSLELTALFCLSAAAAPFLTSLWWKYVIVLICGLLGFHLLFDLRFPALVNMPAAGKWTGMMGVLVLGFLFGLVSIPCSGPVLILLISLVPQIGIPQAGSLLFLYGLGHSILIFAAGLSVGMVQTLADSKGLGKFLHGIKKIAGLLILGVGYYFLRGT